MKELINTKLRGQPGFVEPLTFPQQTVKDIKELKKRIESLEKEIETLKAKKS